MHVCQATYFIGALFSLPNNANTMHSTYFNLLFVFTGFLVRGPLIPNGAKWFYDLNFLRWAMNFVSANELRDAIFQCHSDEYILAAPSYDACSNYPQVTTVGRDPQYLPAGASTSPYGNKTVLKCPYACGTDVLMSFGADYSDNDMARNLGIVAGFATFFAIAAFLTIKHLNHIRR